MGSSSSSKSPAQIALGRIALGRLYNECVALATQTVKIKKNEDLLLRDNHIYILLREFLGKSGKFKWNNKQIYDHLYVLGYLTQENTYDYTTNRERKSNLEEMMSIWKNLKRLIDKELKPEKALSDFNEKLEDWLGKKRDLLHFWENQPSTGFYAGVY